MGRIIPSYRIASEIEILKWRPFRKLLDKHDRREFDEMLSISRLYNAAGSMACRPVLIQVILMSILFEHYKKLTKIRPETERLQLLE
jgi:hypothetical protein